MAREAFVARFGGVFEESPWIAKAVWDAGLGPEHDTAEGLHAAMVAVLRRADRQAQLALIRADPDLAPLIARMDTALDAVAPAPGQSRSRPAP